MVGRKSIVTAPLALVCADAGPALLEGRMSLAAVPSNPFPYLTEQQVITIRSMWRRRYDTIEISRFVGVRESTVYNVLSSIREASRGNNHEHG